MIQHTLGMRGEALATMKAIVKEEPRFWPAWSEMVDLVPNADEVE